MDPVRLPPIKLITYSGSRALRQPDSERSLKKHYLKAIKMHAKRTLFNYGKIFVITRPLPSTIPIPTLFSQPPCLTLQPTTPLMIPNCPTSSKRVLSWRGTQTRHPHLRNGVAVVPRAARTRRVLRAQPLPRPKLPQRLARRGKGVDLLNPRMSRRRVRRVNPLRNAREGGHQNIPSLALPTRTSEREARLTLQPSESGAGPRRMPPKMIFDWMHCIRLWNVFRHVVATTIAPTTMQNNTHFLSLLCCPSDCFIVAIVWYIYLLAPLHLYCPFPVALGSCGHGVFIADLYD